MYSRRNLDICIFVVCRFATCRRADHTIVINRHFNPLSDPYMELLIQMPVFYYLDGNRRQRFLRHETYPPENRRKKREVSGHGKGEDALKWYGEDVEKVPTFSKESTMRLSILPHTRLVTT